MVTDFVTRLIQAAPKVIGPVMSMTHRDPGYLIPGKVIMIVQDAGQDREYLYKITIEEFGGTIVDGQEVHPEDG